VNIARHILLVVIRLYRWVLSPAKQFVFGPAAHCRFTPTCSEYALEAVQRHGAARGTLLAAGRLCRCHPWGGCGPDPVPGSAGVSPAACVEEARRRDAGAPRLLPLAIARIRRKAPDGTVASTIARA
jgi:putative membrane protein insertion efficiency factor